MKNLTKSIFNALLALALVTTISYAQEAQQHGIEVGDTLIIGAPSQSTYSHIHVPRTNFIIKKGGISGIKRLLNTKVVVKGFKRDKTGNTIAILKQSNGKKFFNAYHTIKANISEALKSGELKKT